jgi:hypothetical protein
MRLLAEGKYGRMVCYQPPNVCDVAIADAIGQLNKVDPLGAAVQTARGLGISFGDSLPDPARAGLLPTLELPVGIPLSTLGNF